MISRPAAAGRKRVDGMDYPTHIWFVAERWQIFLKNNPTDQNLHSRSYEYRVCIRIYKMARGLCRQKRLGCKYFLPLN
jgi:hypothetical protein